MCDVRLRDEGSQFGEVNGRGANAEHAMTEGAKSTEKMERGIGGTGQYWGGGGCVGLCYG